METIITVNRTIYPIYPDWVDQEWLNAPTFIALECTGPSQFNVGNLAQWFHEDQKRGVMNGKIIYRYLKKHNMMETCLGLRDLEEIQKKGSEFFRKYFQGKKLVFGMKSVVRSRRGSLRAPCLCESDGQVHLGWRWLINNDWDSRTPTLRYEN